MRTLSQNDLLPKLIRELEILIIKRKGIYNYLKRSKGKKFAQSMSDRNDEMVQKFHSYDEDINVVLKKYWCGEVSFQF